MATSVLDSWRATGLPLFSIIITCFNKKAYIEESIQSALAQKHDSFEVIVVDDGSQDGSWDVIQSLASQNSRLTAVRHAQARNLGEGATRQWGLEVSRGCYSLYLDGDDRLLPGRLQHDEAVIARHPECTSIVSRTRYFHQDITAGTQILCEEEESVDCIAPLTDHLYGLYEFFLACFFDYEQGQPAFKGLPCVGAVTTRREVALAVPWQREFSCAADICYFAEVLMREGVYFSSQCLAEYRLTAEGAWFQSRQDESEGFWQHLTKRHIRFLALGADPVLLEAAHQSFASKLAGRLPEPLPNPDPLPAAAESIAAIPSQPFCPTWGLSRGLPVDRYYVDRFLSRHAGDIRGDVLEVGDDGYSRRFGTAELVNVDILDINQNNGLATVIADLCDPPPDLLPDHYDCIVITQVLQNTKDPLAAIRTLRAITRPGGVILCTCPAISRVSPVAEEQEHWYWSFYIPTVRLLFQQAGFRPADLLIDTWGNLRVTTAFLWGLAQEDLTEADYRVQDPGFPLITTIRATKAL
ncbi:glycosyltransferase [Cyanobium sp. NIES-981]|uniref:glycosyltransferase n=1 Tax=Cyanobium sp. NIES-981 TaxID=1851505 RepID=UPI0007DD73EA|nr:glycosyltransferase [Cyanobium sp. NIES-981]SBO44885.1 protein of unknown function [Cyanobium sp. NIES-981]